MKIAAERINHVQLCIPPGSEDAARAFYADLLGAREVPKPESLMKQGGMWYRLGEVEIHIGLDPVTARTKGHPALEVHGLKDIRGYLASRGIALKEEPFIPGRERFSFHDPFGNRIELMEFVD